VNEALTILQHPFFMGLYGIFAWFALKLSLALSKQTVTSFKEFWEDQKDEVLFTLVLSFAFMIWDDEVIYLYYTYVKDSEVLIQELPRPYYLLLGIGSDKIYKLFK